MKKLIILGGSGIGMIAASVARDLGIYQVLGFLNDVIEPGTSIGKYSQLPVLGRTEDLHSYMADPTVLFFIAYVGLQNEKQTYEKIETFDIDPRRYATLIHPSAVMPRGFCSIGDGVLMAPLSQLSPDTAVSDNCMLLPNAFLGHDSFMDRFAHIATNGVVGANVHVGRAVHVGSNATIREKVRIGDFSLIGAGSVVLKDVGENAVVAGNPARVLKERGM